MPSLRWVAVVLGMMVLALAARGASPASPAGDASKHINQTSAWYRQVLYIDQSPTSAQDVLYRDTVREQARQALRLSLDYARAEAALLNATPAATAPTTEAGKPDRARSLAQAAATAIERVAQMQSDLDRLNTSLRSASPEDVPVLTARREKLVAQLDLAVARRDVLMNLSGFMSGLGGTGVNGLLERIDDLERSIPEARRDATGNPATRPAADAASAQLFRPESAGLIGLLTQMFAISREMSAVSALANQTAALNENTDELRLPVKTSLQDAVRRGDALATTQESSDAAKLGAEAAEIRAITTRFKQISKVGVPLGEQSAFLGSIRENLGAWRDALDQQYHDILRRLLIRVGVMGSVILVTLVVSSLWRRATFRYIVDARRRRQFMFLRRIIVGFVIAIVVGIGFITEFGSLATFAGILTAGIAVALQTVILSGVAYFFFIGRYGVRVGERITVSGVTGEVIDTGLFRLYMMELGGANGLQPTGRVVVFSNSVLFQPSAFYKQLPGAEYVWHQVAITLSAGSDHKQAEDRLLGAVQKVFAGHRHDIERQHAAVKASTHLQIDMPEPEGRLRFVDAGLEFTVRYPATLRRAEEMDDQVTRQLLAALREEPKLQLLGVSAPKMK